MERRKELDPDDLNRPDWNSLKANYDKHDVGEAYLKGRVEQMGLQVEHWGIDMRHDDDSLIFDDKMDLRLWEPRDGQSNAPNAPDDFRGTTWSHRTLDGDRRSYLIAEDRGIDMDERVNPARIDNEAWELKGVTDVKTKANPDWLGVLNLRHLAHYAEHAEKYDVPVFLYFTMVDMNEETVGSRNIFVPIPTDWAHDLVRDHFAPDGQTMAWGNLKTQAANCSIVDRVFRAPDGNPVVQTDEDTWRDFDWFEETVLDS